MERIQDRRARAQDKTKTILPAIRGVQLQKVRLLIEASAYTIKLNGGIYILSQALAAFSVIVEVQLCNEHF